jgi:hypothetical protein
LGKSTLAAFLAMWVAIAALAYLVVREIGWVRLKKYWLALTVLVLALSALPAGAVFKLGAPYKDRILARLIPHHSPPVDLGAGCSVFPENNIWNARVRDLPLDANSSVYIQSMGPDAPLHADFSVPYAVTDGSDGVAEVALSSDESDRGPYRIPDGAPIEGGGGDAHVIVLDRGACRLYELFAAARVGHLSWQASSGAIFDLRSNRLRPEGWTSADAAGLPLFAGLVRYDEVKNGQIRHALRFTTPHTRRAFVWPARHFASSSNDPSLPSMGQRFRLRGSFDVSGLTPEAQVILTALKDYGMFVSDNGGAWYLTGALDSNWNSRTIADLKRVTGSDFEAVDTSMLMVAPDSGEVRR